MPVTLRIEESLENSKPLAAVDVDCHVQRVGFWAQRMEPPPLTPVYLSAQNTWSEGKADGETLGIYLGHALVMVIGPSSGSPTTSVESCDHYSPGNRFRDAVIPRVNDPSYQQR